jgi:hypothetical protein
LAINVGVKLEARVAQVQACVLRKRFSTHASGHGPAEKSATYHCLPSPRGEGLLHLPCVKATRDRSADASVIAAFLALF